MSKADEFRDFPHNTCGSTRRLQIVADQLLTEGHSIDVQENPIEIAEAIDRVVAELYRLRTKDADEKRMAEKIAAAIHSLRDRTEVGPEFGADYLNALDDAAVIARNAGEVSA